MGTRRLITLLVAVFLPIVGFCFDIGDRQNIDHMRDKTRLQVYQDFPYGGEARIGYDLGYTHVINPSVTPTPTEQVTDGVPFINDVGKLPIMIEGNGKIKFVDAVTMLSRSLGFSNPEVMRESLNNMIIVLPSVQGDVEGYLEFLETKCSCNINLYSRTKSVVVF